MKKFISPVLVTSALVTSALGAAVFAAATAAAQQGSVQAPDPQGARQEQLEMEHPKNAPGQAEHDRKWGKEQHSQQRDQARGRYADRQEMSHDQIRAVQQALNENGAKLQVDGRMGQRTRQALLKFQRDNQLEASGRPDEATLSKLDVDTTQTSNER